MTCETYLPASTSFHPRRNPPDCAEIHGTAESLTRVCSSLPLCSVVMCLLLSSCRLLLFAHQVADILPNGGFVRADRLVCNTPYALQNVFVIVSKPQHLAGFRHGNTVSDRI